MYLRHVIRCKDCVTSIYRSISVQLDPSCFFSLEIFNSKLNRYPEDALYARNGSRSCKNITRGRGRRRLKNAEAVLKGRRLSSAARHRKISDEHQNHLSSNIHLEGKLIKKSTISGLLGSFNGKWQGFSMVGSEKASRIVYISW